MGLHVPTKALFLRFRQTDEGANLLPTWQYVKF